MTFRIAQISDTHLSAEKPFFVGNFERIGEALRATLPDLVLNSGDISLSGESKESDLSAARALHEAIGLPVRFLPGNHDLGDSQDLATHGAAVITDERRARYLAQARARGQRLQTGAEILASPSRSTDPPSDEELLAFLDVIYDARRVDA